MKTDKLILVTGITGWLGKNLHRSFVSKLEHFPDSFLNDEKTVIRCLVKPNEDILEFKKLSKNIQFVEGSVSNLQDCERFCENAKGAILIHMAGVVHPKNVAEFYTVNEIGTRNLIEAASQNGISRFVHVSSNSPFGCNNSNDGFFDEISPYNPYMNYGRSKMKAEEIVQACSEKGNMETVILRPPWFYGVFQPPRQTLFFTMIRLGKFPLFGDGENKRSMVYLENLCQAIHLAALMPNISGEAFWIADENAYSMNEIVSTIQLLLKDEFQLEVSEKRLKLPSFISDTAQVFDWALQGLGVYNQKIHVLSEMNKTIVCSIEHAKKKLGYRPYFDLTKGMTESIRWCLETRNL